MRRRPKASWHREKKLLSDSGARLVIQATSWPSIPAVHLPNFETGVRMCFSELPGLVETDTVIGDLKLVVRC